MNLFQRQKIISQKRIYQICKRCVMDTTDPWIEFDANGICNHCKTYYEKRYMPIDSIKNKIINL